MGAEGILAAIMGPAAQQLGFSLPAGLEWAEFDYFHDLILAEECQAGSIAQTLPIPPGHTNTPCVPKYRC